jgi:hypothetical protein
MEPMVVVPKARACCQATENLELRDSGKPDLELRVCRVCGARHFELTVDPVALGVEIP